MKSSNSTYLGAAPPRGRPGLAVVALAGLLSAVPAQAQTFTVANFRSEVIFTGAGTTGLDFGPSGILYLIEKRGRIMALVPDGQGGFQTPEVFADIQVDVDSGEEAGLLGIAVDPEFTTNRHIYVLYTTTTDQRLVRYTADAAGTSSTASAVVLSGLPRTYNFHKAGDIKFRPGENNNIYIAQGDDGFPDEAQDLTSLRGKMLRVNKVTGDGLASNPYYVSGPLDAPQARIWAIGFRNPFRFAFHPSPSTPAADVMYVSENGDSTDKLSWVRAGSDGAWSIQGDSGGFLNPPDANHKVLFTGNPSHIGIAIATSGPFSDGGSPVIYLSNFIFPTGGSILRWGLSGPNLDIATPLPTDGGLPFARQLLGTHLQFGPDGALYWTTTDGDDAPSGFVTGRIRYVGGAAPTASFITNPTPAVGPPPLTVQFTDGSFDSDGTIAGWAWDFGDGATSTLPSPSHTYAAAGSYPVTLQVTDNSGLSNLVQSQVTVEASLSLTLTGNIYDGRFVTDRAFRNTQIRLYEGDGETPIEIPGGRGPDDNGIRVIGGVINATVPVQVRGSMITVSAAENNGRYQTQWISFEVPAGTTSFSQNLVFRPSRTAISGRVTDTRGAPVAVDIGVAEGEPSNLYELSGGRDYLPGSGISSSGVAHRVVSDIGGNYYLPLRDGGTYFLDIVGDTNAGVYISTDQETAVALNATATAELTVGLQNGGAGCDDLSGIAATANVDYSTQIQPVWSACLGCHRPNSANGGGLDLTAANSFLELVGTPSSQVPGRNLVAGSQVSNSYLFEKINCSDPQVGNRMRPDSAMSLADQALVRDWIDQGAAAVGIVAEICDDGADNDGDGDEDCDDSDCSAFPACVVQTPVTLEESGSLDQGEWDNYGPFTVSTGTDVVVFLDRQRRNPDLYVRWGSAPTTSDYDCRPYFSGSPGDETCELTVPAGVTELYVGVRGRNRRGDNNYEVEVTYTPAP